MVNVDPLNKLMYQHEVLRAQYEIREQYLNGFIRDVYENIGQVLSLASMEVGILQEEASDASKGRVNRIGELVRKAIGDLRQMGANLYSELNGFKVDDLVKALNLPSEPQKPALPEFRIIRKGTQQPVSSGKGVILLRILQVILTEITKKGILISASALSQEDSLTFNIQFKGDWPHQLSEIKEDNDHALCIKEKIELIGGEITMNEHGPAELNRQITIHLKNCYNG